jgi:hypothetical protein
LRCPGCGIELSHNDLNKKECGGCGYFLPVINSKKSVPVNDGKTMPINMQQIKAMHESEKKDAFSRIPLPTRKVVSMGINVVSEPDEFKSGEVNSPDKHNLGFVTNEPSISTDEPEIIPSVLKKQRAQERRKKMRQERRQKKSFEKTIRIQLPPPEIVEDDTKRFWKDILLISIIIIPSLIVAFLLINYLK